jgi:hypothetical protein
MSAPIRPVLIDTAGMVLVLVGAITATLPTLLTLTFPSRCSGAAVMGEEVGQDEVSENVNHQFVSVQVPDLPSVIHELSLTPRRQMKSPEVDAEVILSPALKAKPFRVMTSELSGLITVAEAVDWYTQVDIPAVRAGRLMVAVPVVTRITPP